MAGYVKTKTRRIVPVHEQTAPASASGIAYSGHSVFNGLIVKTDGTNDVTLNVYDNTAASGTRLLPSDVIVPGTARLFVIEFNRGIECQNGIYVDGTCSGSFEWQALYDSAE